MMDTVMQIAKRALSVIRVRRDCANDLLQEALLQIWKLIKRGKIVNVEDNDGYIFRVAVNAMLKYLYRVYGHKRYWSCKSRTCKTTKVSVSYGIEDEALRDMSDERDYHDEVDNRIDLDICLSKLPQHYRSVLSFWLDGGSLADYARQNAMTGENARYLLNRALDKAREILTNGGEK
ncbi:MAG: sigma-70 family RNA polymerase sigma factor [Nitrososphaerales archaeon]